MLETIHRIKKTILDGLALKGYDPVAYHTEGRAIEGRKEFAHEYANATWRFASPNNRDRFVADPKKYAPQYGGYCAWGISQGKFLDGDPQVWQIVDGTLYVHYNKAIQKTWERDIPGLIAKADGHWSTMEQLD